MIIKYRKFIIVILIFVAASINATATKMFLVPAGLLPAGTSALAIALQNIIKYFTHINILYYYLFFVINLPLLVWGWYKLGQNVVFKTVLHVVFFTIVSAIVPQHIMITDNIFINCLSGGIFFGFSNTILLYVGASATGLDLIGLYVNTKKNANVMGKVNFIFNLMIYIIYIPFASYEKSFLSLVANLITAQISDEFHINSNYVLLMIITKKGNLVNQYINEKTKRGSTTLNSFGGYSQLTSKTIFTVISKHRFKQTLKHLKMLDSQIYVVVLPTQQILGKMTSMVGKSNI